MSQVRELIYSALSGETTITDIVSTRIYEKHLEDTTTPCLVYDVRYINGTPTNEGVEIESENLLTIKCYADTEPEIIALSRAVDSFLSYHRSANLTYIEKQRDLMEHIDELDQYIVTTEFIVNYQM